MTRQRTAWAKIDQGLMADPKVVKLARRQKDEQRTMVSMALYVSAILTSWREDEPVSLDDSAPAWFHGMTQPFVEDLRAVGLLDETGAIPVATLDRWMEQSRQAVVLARTAAALRWHGGGSAPAVPGQSGRKAGAMQIDREIDREIDVRRSRDASTRARRDSRGAAPRALGDIMKDMELDQ